ncbi:MAG: S49 family peptidase, partial [Bacteroidota bacterium]|nr:S49 family peptidase [Bacteroidota bacterium]
MRSFFKIFFASFLALLLFTLLVFFFLFVFIAGLTRRETPTVQSKSVLVLNLGEHYRELAQENPLSAITGDDESDIPGLYDVVRLLHKAKTDGNIQGIYIIANSSPNGFAASEEIRNALVDFKQSKKFIIAHGDVITQKAFHVANVADKLYANPKGFVEWNGYSVDIAFLKGTLNKLDIEPQIFYAGKFKSATEPFRTDKMTDENKLQTTVWL